MLRKHLGPQAFSHSRHRSPVVFVAVGGACLGQESSMSTPCQFLSMRYEPTRVPSCTGQEKSTQLRLGQKSTRKLFNLPRKSSASGTGGRGRGKEPVRAAPFHSNKSLMPMSPSKSIHTWRMLKYRWEALCISPELPSRVDGRILASSILSSSIPQSKCSRCAASSTTNSTAIPEFGEFNAGVTGGVTHNPHPFVRHPATLGS